MENRKPLPTKDECPNGLHGKYLIKKFVGWDRLTAFNSGKRIPIYKDVDPDSEYFVLRLDEKQKDQNHLYACRLAINVYAEAIEATIPQLAKDLRERYPLTNIK